MFQKKDVEAYQNVKASGELKNRIRLSIKQQKSRVRKQQMMVVAAAACLMLVFSVSGVLNQNSTILSVNDIAVTHRALELESSVNYSLATASGGRSCEPLIIVPMEIDVKELAHIQVSDGTLHWEMEIDTESEKRTEMEIAETTVIYWMVSGDINNTPSCTIATGGEVYTYVIDFEESESVFIIKQKSN